MGTMRLVIPDRGGTWDARDHMFDGFRLDFVDVGEVRLRVRYGGNGPAVLLVHGHPRTHTTWCDVAASLVEAGYSVVCPDLRGYGESSAARPPRSFQASKRAMAEDLAALMEVLGYGRLPRGRPRSRA